MANRRFGVNPPKALFERRSDLSLVNRTLTEVKPREIPMCRELRHFHLVADRAVFKLSNFVLDSRLDLVRIAAISRATQH